MASDNSFELSDNMSGTNTPSIYELFEECKHLGEHISYNAESDKLYICHDGGASGFAISHMASGSYKSMLYYGAGNMMTSGYYYTKMLSSDNICELLTIIGNKRLYDVDRSGDIHEFFQSLNNQSN